MLILNYSWAVWLAWLMAALFVASGGWRVIGMWTGKDALAKAARRSWIWVGIGVSEIGTGLAVAWYPTRPLGLLLGVLICIAACITSARQGNRGRLVWSIVVLALLLVTAWGLRLI